MELLKQQYRFRCLFTGCDDRCDTEEGLKQSLLLWCSGANTRQPQGVDRYRVSPFSHAQSGQAGALKLAMVGIQATETRVLYKSWLPFFHLSPKVGYPKHALCVRQCHV